MGWSELAGLLDLFHLAELKKRRLHLEAPRTRAEPRIDTRFAALLPS